jgi:hypothetical protein
MNSLLDDDIFYPLSDITLDLMKNTLGFSDSDIEKFQQLEFQTLPVTLKCPT